jgi:hypothetical protein
MELEVEKLTVKITSGAIINTKGIAKNQDVLVSAGAIYEGKELITEQTVISSNAGSEGVVFATESIDAKARAGSDIVVYGNPKQITKKTFAGGHIKIVK